MSMTQTTRIVTLRVCARGPVATASRLATEDLMGQMDLRPDGMPPAAVLIVRNLASPVPITVRQGRAPIQYRSNPEYAVLVRERLTFLYRHAAHPERGTIPATADAVLFRDESEMLACLAHDLSQGKRLQCWWWHWTRREYRLSAWNPVPGFLLSRIRWLPAILAHLRAWDRVVPVLARLESPDIRALLEALVREYDLCPDLLSTKPLELNEPVAAISRQSEPVKAAKMAGGQDPFVDEGTAAMRGTTTRSDSRSPQHKRALVSAPPWRRWLSVAMLRHLSATQEYLLGLSLLLFYPSVGTSVAFFEAATWWRNRKIGIDLPEAGLDTARFSKQYAPRLDFSHGEPPIFENWASVVPMQLRFDPKTSLPKADSSREVLSRERPESRFASDNLLQLKWTIDDPPSSSPESKPEPGPMPIGLEVPMQRTPDATISSILAPASRDLRMPAGTLLHGCSDPALSEGLPTRLGGVLYLINLMTSLNLPDCFEADWHLTSRLGRWGLLELLARALLAEALPMFLEDPIWASLTELDGRRFGEPPGQGLAAQEVYRIPKPWIEKDLGPCFWASDGRRLRLWSDSGYCLLDVPRNQLSARKQIDAEREEYFTDTGLDARKSAGMPSGQLKQPLAFEPPPGIARWLGYVLPFIDYRLRLALPAERVDGGNFLRVPGRLYITSSHVDLVAQLDAISLPERMAGLDRDPGWVGGLRRVVSFHFQ